MIAKGGGSGFRDVPALRRDLDGQRAAARGPGARPGRWYGGRFFYRAPAKDGEHEE